MIKQILTPSYSHIFVSILTIILLTLFSCRKEYTDPNNTNGNYNSMHTTTDSDPWLSFRKYNPYAMSTVRALRNALSGDGRQIIQDNYLMPLKTNNYYLYYKIKIDNESDAETFNNWLDSDTNNIAVKYPMDSVAMYPHLFTESVLDSLQESHTVFYTTVPQSQGLPSIMNTTLLDTLYVPDSTEFLLDFTLNLVTANFSKSYVDFLATQDSAIHAGVVKFINDEAFLEDGVFNPNTNPGEVPDEDHFRNTIYEVTGPVLNWDRIYGNGIAVTEITRNITFTDNWLNVNEGVNNLNVIFSRFAFFIQHHSTRTNTNGSFTNNIPNFGYAVMNLIYKSNHVRIRSMDVSSKVVATAIYQVLKNSLTVISPATHTSLVNPQNINNNVTLNFPHGSKHALWSITYNAIQEANQYTINLNMRANQSATKFIDVLSVYRNDADNAGYAAPMLHYIGSYPEGKNKLFHLANISSMTGNALPGPLPDLWIGGGVNNPENSQWLRQTIYHEYGHSLHYFKANTVNNNHWKQNIVLSIGPDYGNAITSTKGEFFALSEGWADYIGHTFAFTKYGTGVQQNEWNVWTNTIVNDNYQGLLERVPTALNNFIPRGLFFDLTDGFNAIENFDNIQGFTTNDIYQKLNPTMYTIQEFRTRWETDHPNANNAILFDEYDVN